MEKESSEIGMNTCDSSLKDIKKGDKLIMFSSENCKVCEESFDKLTEIEIDDTKTDNIPEEFTIIHQEDCPSILDEFEIKEYPTFIRIKDGKEIGRVEGFNGESLKNLLENPQENNKGE
jgi:thioredoxin-related protein